MSPYLALIRMNLRLALRERSVLFFNYVFPLVFFFGFGQFMGGRASGGAMTRIVSMVLVIGILGSGLFGAGMRAVVEREAGILRRYKVTPITPLPLLVASLVTGWLLYLPSAALIIGLSHAVYGMPWPERPVSLAVLVTLGCFAFRAIGLIIASVANSVAESNVLIQILYMPMLFLSGATIPISSMPLTAQIIAQFLPASYLNSGVQHVMLRAEGIATSFEPVAALLASTAVALWISMKLFRWEKDEKLPARSKVWVLVTLAPFVLLGTYQAWSRDHIDHAKQLDREIRRNVARLIRGATVFVGDGAVIRGGSVLVRNGAIEEVFNGGPPDIQAEIVEAAGKTVLPGLIDTRVRLVQPHDASLRALAAYLYCGVTAVGSTEPLTASPLAEVRRAVNSGAWLGAELFAAPAAGAYYTPALSGIEAAAQFRLGKLDFLSRSLVEQVAPPGLIASIRAGGPTPPETDLEQARENLRRAAKTGTPLVMGTASGTTLLIHGPAIHRELQLWVDSGIPPAAALRAATYDAARALGAAGRIGLIRKGYDATLLVVDGNPLEDVTATERMSLILYRGERVDRQDLFDQK